MWNFDGDAVVKSLVCHEGGKGTCSVTLLWYDDNDDNELT